MGSSVYALTLLLTACPGDSTLPRARVDPDATFAPPTHTYTVAGTYTITLVAANSCNTSTSTVSPIIVVGAGAPALTNETKQVFEAQIRPKL